MQNGTSRPYYIREKGLKPSGVYIRQGSSNQQLSDEGIRRMLIEVNGKSYESMRSMQQELTFTALRKHFQQRELKLTRRSCALLSSSVTMACTRIWRCCFPSSASIR